MKRDTKKLYLMAKKKIIKNLIGYNSKIKYEVSKYKKLTIKTEYEAEEESLKKITNYIKL